MNRMFFLMAASALAAVPAVMGLAANPALRHRVPVRVPSGAQRVQDARTTPDAPDDLAAEAPGQG